jgi:hypothetical protein
VFGLPEGDWLRVRGEEITLHGVFEGKWFRSGTAPETVQPGSRIAL